MSFSDVELRHLRALIAVAEEGSFGGAADALRLSQAAISQQIAGLERAIGQRAFDRPGGPRPVTLTPAGRLLLERAGEIMALLEGAADDLDDLSSGTAGRLTVGTYQSVSVQLLPDVVSDMRAQAPDLSISLIEHDRNEELVDDLLAGSLDVTFLAGPYEHEDLDLTLLGTDPFVLLLPADSELAHEFPGRKFPTSRLADIALVGEHEPRYGAGTISS